jgi:hypothetical protein
VEGKFDHQLEDKEDDIDENESADNRDHGRSKSKFISWGTRGHKFKVVNLE